MIYIWTDFKHVKGSGRMLFIGVQCMLLDWALRVALVSIVQLFLSPELCRLWCQEGQLDQASCHLEWTPRPAWTL